MPTPTLNRRLAALERQVPEPAPKSELCELLPYMDDAELELMHDIATRADAQGNVRTDDLEDFERICLAAMERRSNGEPNMKGSAR